MTTVKFERNVYVMNTLNSTKKTSLLDWHPADIVAALRKKGWSLRRLSVYHELRPLTLGRAISVPYPKAERIIADVIGVKPEAIWPSRYDQHGMPNRGRKPRYGRLKCSTLNNACNEENHVGDDANAKTNR